MSWVLVTGFTLSYRRKESLENNMVTMVSSLFVENKNPGRGGGGIEDFRSGTSINVGAAIIGIGFWGFSLYYKTNTEPPKSSRGN